MIFVAIIKQFEREPNDTVKANLTEVICSYSISQGSDGRNYLRLRTRGSENISVSQTLHMDKNAAQKLSEIIQAYLQEDVPRVY